VIVDCEVLNTDSDFESAISNQQSAISNQQSAISNQQSHNAIAIS
jgi:hypothetical protein